MPFSVSVYDSGIVFSPEQINRLKAYNVRNTPDVAEFSRSVSVLEVGEREYYSIDLGKKIVNHLMTYKVNEHGNLVRVREEKSEFHAIRAYFAAGISDFFLMNIPVNWIGKFVEKVIGIPPVLSQTKLKEIDTIQLEEDCRVRHKFTFIGDRHTDQDFTKISFLNKAGIDMSTYKLTRDTADLRKDHLGIIVPVGNHNLNVLVYPKGKITILSARANPDDGFEVFLKAWARLSDYY